MPDPQLPIGASSAFSTLNATFAFHSSPESFISSRIREWQQQQQDDAPSGPNQPRRVIGARILNRRVAILSSFAHVEQVLHQQQQRDGDAGPACVAGDAYRAFMAPFFPAPNLLLADGSAHAAMRPRWERRVESAQNKVQALVRRVAKEHFGKLCVYQPDNASGSRDAPEIDLYESMKQLSWKLLLGFFLGLTEENAGFARIQQLQEELLRGQFSLFPVSVDVGWWKSPRQKGISAKAALQQLILQRLREGEDVCPFSCGSKNLSDAELEDVGNHILLFTSSLSVKSLASLLTAFLLNLTVFERGGVKLRDQLEELEPAEKQVLLQSILKETERLSPPIVGIMRRVTEDTVIREHDGSDVLVPNGWDMWIYFAGAARDTSAFGADADAFVPERFMNKDSGGLPDGLAFSAGSKRCLGESLVREIVMAVGQTILDLEMKLDGRVDANGVRSWLGWKGAEMVPPEDWARDMKQLPTQHPAEPVKIRVRGNGVRSEF